MQPQLKLVVQDRASVVADGPKRWSDSHGDVLASGRVAFQGMFLSCFLPMYCSPLPASLSAHDFFQPQPVQGAAAYLLKSIIHDWSDSYATQILTRIREAAAPGSKLLVIDRILPYACRIAGEDVEALNALGIETEDVPEPLPPNLGAGNPTAYATDLNVRTHFILPYLGSRCRFVDPLPSDAGTCKWARAYDRALYGPIQCVPVEDRPGIPVGQRAVRENPFLDRSSPGLSLQYLSAILW